MRILLIDDEKDNLDYLSRVLRNYTTETFTNPEKAVRYAADNQVDIIISDQKMPAMTGIECIKRIREQHNDFIALVVSAYTDADDLIDAVNSNLIYKYITKPFSPGVLLQNVLRAEEALLARRRQANEEARLKTENDRLSLALDSAAAGCVPTLDTFIGFTPAVQALKDAASMYAQSDQPVLLIGETGTGKELLARAIHELSPRKEHPFVAVNCSAFSEHLLESELFGHVKGAFTGAVRDHEGFVKTADKGTLFLDEIGDFPLPFQAKILRFIQFGTYYPVGSSRERKLDVRIISATNSNLEEEVNTGRFRQDLYYRINTLTLPVPSLRDRVDDILFILEYLAAGIGYVLPPFTEDARRMLEAYPFPGNVRELENFVKKLKLLSATSPFVAIDRRHIEKHLYPHGGGAAIVGQPNDQHRETTPIAEMNGNQKSLTLAEHVDLLEKEIILRKLGEESYNITRTAGALGLSRQGLRSKMKRLDIIHEDSKS